MRNEYDTHRKLRLILDLTVAATIITVAIVVCAIIVKVPSSNSLAKVSYEEYAKIAQTGDVIVFSSSEPELRWTAMYAWTHVGIVIRAPNSDNILLYESVYQDGSNTLKDEFLGEAKIDGPQVVDLRTKLSTYNGVFAYRRLVNKELLFDNEKRFHMVYSMFKEFSSIRYDLNLGYWLTHAPVARALPIPVPYVPGEATERRAMICSELVAHLWDRLGAMKSGLKFYSFIPKDFLGNRWKKYLTGNWALEPVVRIIDVPAQASK